MTNPSGSRPRGLYLWGVPILQPLDLVIGLLVLAFFVGAALLGGGDLRDSAVGAVAIMLVMFLVGAAVEFIIDALRDMPGLGTVVGFITNGPEALCLLVGLLSNDIIFAASTPLGSNFMNPAMLVAAAIAAGCLGAVFRHHRAYGPTALILTAILAAAFFRTPPEYYWAWIIVTGVVSIVLFVKRPGDPASIDTIPGSVSRWRLIPALAVLFVAGYALDPVVDYTADASHAPKGAIGFFVLAALTSWPEFRSGLTLLRRGRTTSAVLNIIVSNITNLWLAGIGVLIHLLLQRG